MYGLANGSIFALIALGYTMVYGIVELINFAHGDVFTLGGFISLWLLPIFGITEGGSVSGAGLILPLLAILVISMLACAVVNVTIERVAYRPLRHAPRLTPLITAVGMSFVLEGVMFLWRGPFNLHYPNVLPTAGIELGGANGPAIAFKDLAVIAIAIVLMVALRCSSSARSSARRCAPPRRTATPRSSWASTSTARSPRRSSSARCSPAPAG